MTTRSGLLRPPETRSGWNPLTLAFLAGLWIAALPNWPLWQALLALPETASLRGAIFVGGFALMIGALTGALLALLAWHATLKPAIAFMLLAAALGAYFMGSYGVVIDTTMMANVAQTDPREVRDLLNLRLLGHVLVLAGLPMAVVWRIRLRRIGLWRQAVRNALGIVAALTTLGALIFLLFADLSTTMRNHRSIRYLINPVNSLYAVADLALQANAKPAGPPRPIGIEARIMPRAAGVKPPLLLLVVGETARADHFSLNGYTRPTNPQLATTDVLSFSNVSSCGTSTATSLPCMFSHLGKAGFESRGPVYENLLDLARRAGMAVLWLDNQAGCKGLCDRVPNANARDAVAGAPALPAGMCNGNGDDEECLDEALLIGLDARIAALPARARERGVLLVLHQMGSHGPAYYKRSPADRKPFQPECTTNVLQQCDRASLVNAYDNTIAYTDHVLAGAMQWLAGQRPRYQASLLYISDHGESLGENNLYLHGLPYALAPHEQTHVPMLLWLDEWAMPAGSVTVPRACVAGRRDVPLSHDNLFHSVLGLLGIQASEYKSTLDPLAACRAP